MNQRPLPAVGFWPFAIPRLTQRPGSIGGGGGLGRVGLGFGGLSLAHGALGVDARPGVDGLVADRAAGPGGESP